MWVIEEYCQGSLRRSLGFLHIKKQVTFDGYLYLRESPGLPA